MIWHGRAAEDLPELRWLERGEGEPVVLLHGLMSRMEHWEESLDGLGAVCRAMAPSLPIFDARLDEPSVRALAGHVLRLLDALEIPRAVVGGNSLGGRVALELALSAPDRVSGLILAGSAGLLARVSARAVLGRPTIEHVRARMCEVVSDPALITPEWVASVWEAVSTRAFARRVIRLARAIRRERIEERLGAIGASALLVWGREDRITPPAAGERFRALLPDAELWFLPRCGHMPMLERPRDFCRIVAGWLDSTRARRGGQAQVERGAR